MVNNKNRPPTNVLLLKNPVGKSKPSTFELPGKDHVYGKKVERKDEGAGQVLTNWNVVQKKQETEPGLDYIAMNRYAAKNSVLDAKSQANFRKDHPIRRKKVNPQIKNEDLLPSDKDGSYTYGMPTRPSTPVARLMTDYYQEEWIRNQEKKRVERESQHNEQLAQQSQRALRSKFRAHMHQPNATASAADPSATEEAKLNNALPSNGHKEKHAHFGQRQKIIDKNVADLFKLSKFKKVGPKISSYRPDDDPAIVKYRNEKQVSV